MFSQQAPVPVCKTPYLRASRRQSTNNHKGNGTGLLFTQCLKTTVSQRGCRVASGGGSVKPQPGIPLSGHSVAPLTARCPGMWAQPPDSRLSSIISMCKQTSRERTNQNSCCYMPRPQHLMHTLPALWTACISPNGGPALGFLAWRGLTTEREVRKSKLLPGFPPSRPQRRSGACTCGAQSPRSHSGRRLRPECRCLA